MIKRISTVVAVMGAAGVISGCAIEQPSAGCFVQDASFANWSGKYTLVSQPDAAVTCDDLTGDVLGVWKYFDPDASAETVAQNRAAKLAIRPRRAAQITAYTYQFQKKDPTTGAPTRARKQVNADGTKVRVSVKSGAEIASPAPTQG